MRESDSVILNNHSCPLIGTRLIISRKPKMFQIIFLTQSTGEKGQKRFYCMLEDPLDKPNNLCHQGAENGLSAAKTLKTGPN